MKNIILLNFFILFFLSTSPSWAVDYPNIPKGIDSKTFCDARGGKFGHVITIIDLTSELDVAQIKFIKDQVFSKEFYLGYYPFTKFSYILIDNKSAQTQEFHFSKCRPKTGDKKLRKDSFKFFELIKLKKEEGEKNKVRTAIDKRKVRIRNKL